MQNIPTGTSTARLGLRGMISAQTEQGRKNLTRIRLVDLSPAMKLNMFQS